MPNLMQTYKKIRLLTESLPIVDQSKEIATLNKFYTISKKLMLTMQDGVNDALDSIGNLIQAGVDHPHGVAINDKIKQERFVRDYKNLEKQVEDIKKMTNKTISNFRQLMMKE